MILSVVAQCGKSCFKRNEEKIMKKILMAIAGLLFISAMESTGKASVMLGGFNPNSRFISLPFNADGTFKIAVPFEKRKVWKPWLGKNSYPVNTYFPSSIPRVIQLISISDGESEVTDKNLLSAPLTIAQSFDFPSAKNKIFKSDSFKVPSSKSSLTTWVTYTFSITPGITYRDVSAEYQQIQFTATTTDLQKPSNGPKSNVTKPKKAPILTATLNFTS